MDQIELFAIAGFALAGYSIVANDVIQTLGTFLSSNGSRPWWQLWIFACSIIVAVMAVGWFACGGDIAFDRLNQIPYRPFVADDGRPGWLAAIDPPGGVEWYHVAPPLVLLLLTRIGIPVSTTFLVLTVFTLTTAASVDANVLPKMLVKSGVGYLVAFGAGAVIYVAVSRFFERWVANTRDARIHPGWYAAQWLATGYLWYNWLVQDLANIFVFLPRDTTTAADGTISVTFDPVVIIFATLLMLVLHAWIFATRGGEIQKIVLSKVNTTDVRAATLIDFTYGTVLWYFKELNDLPMSTTWVFLGLLAGREIGIALSARLRSFGAVGFDLVTDAMRALIGLFISVALAIGVPRAAGAPALVDIGYVGVFAVIAAAFILGGVLWWLRRYAQPGETRG